MQTHGDKPPVNFITQEGIALFYFAEEKTIICFQWNILIAD